MKKILMRLAPLLVIYIVIVLAFSTPEFKGDEERYLKYASHLVQGYYTDKDNPNLGNGPTYPILLSPFVFFDAPLITMRLLNAILLFFGILYFYNLLRLYLKERRALFVTYIAGLYPLTLLYLPNLFTEPLTFLLVNGACFHLCYVFQGNNGPWRQLALVSIYLALLILAKVIFAYVIMLGFVFLLFFSFFIKSDKSRPIAVLCIGSIALCTPYLAHTHSLTGKSLYWGTQGGAILYWKTSPFPEEYGNWHKLETLASNTNPTCLNQETIKYHIANYRKIQHLSFVKQDEWLRKYAIENLKNYPSRYVINTIASFGRLFFNYPYSYTPQKLTTYFYLLPNMFLFVISVISAIVGFLRYRLIPWELRVLFVFFIIYVGGICLLNGIPRHLFSVFPIMILLNAFVISRLISIQLTNEAYSGPQKRDDIISKPERSLSEIVTR